MRTNAATASWWEAPKAKRSARSWLRRRKTEATRRDRPGRAQTEGELKGDVDGGDLARCIATLIQGMAVQAAGGATGKSLHRVVKPAMRAWPGTD